MLKISMTFPDREQEMTLAQRMLGDNAPEATLEGDTVREVASASMLPEMQRWLQEIVVQRNEPQFSRSLRARHGNSSQGIQPSACARCSLTRKKTATAAKTTEQQHASVGQFAHPFWRIHVFSRAKHNAFSRASS